MRDYRKLQSLSGSTEDKQLEEAYNKYVEDQLKKDVQKTEKMIQKKQKEIDKIDSKIEKLNTMQDALPMSNSGSAQTE